MTEAELKGIAFCFIAGGGMVYRAIRTKKITREIADTPRSKTASAPQGLVELEGFAWPAGEVARCVSGEEVVYYRLEIQRAESRGSGKNRRTEWVSVFTHAPCAPFYVVDATGLALITPVTCEVDTHGKKTRSWGSLRANERKGVLAICAGKSIPGFPPADGFFGLFSSSYRIVENKIGIGSPLYVKGDFRTPTGGLPKVKAPGLSEFASRVFNAQARSLKNLRHFLDRNRDGVVTGEEARYGYGFAARQSRMKATKGAVEEKEFEVHGHVGTSPENRLLIADAHQDHLLARRGKYVWLQLVAGAALIALGSASLFPQVDLIQLISGRQRVPAQVR